MCNKKVFILFPVLLLLALNPWQAAAQGTTSPNDVSTMIRPLNVADQRDEEKMRFVQPTLKAERLLLRPTMKLMSMDEQMVRLEQKTKLRQQTLRSRLSKFQDEKKKNTLLNLDTKIGSISAHSLMVMSEAINRMTNILNSAQEKSALAKTQGVNTMTLDSAISEANAALASASAAVTQLNGKEYQIPVTTEEAAKTNAGQTVSTMQNDLRKAHQAVMNAKQALMKVLMELKKVWKQVKPTGVMPTVSATEQPLPTNTVSPTDMEEMPVEEM